MAGQKDNNLNLRKECCNYCRCDGDYCNYRNELTEDVGSKFKGDDGLIYTKGCIHFEWD